MGDMKRAAIYVRVAHADQMAADAQTHTLREYAQKNGYGEPRVYIDNGASGLNLNRPALREMEADIDAGAVNTVVVQSISRIGRNFIETDRWIRDLEERGIDLITVDGSYNKSCPQVLKAFAHVCHYNRTKRRTAAER